MARSEARRTQNFGRITMAATQTLDISPVGRVEGDLDVRVDIENGISYVIDHQQSARATLSRVVNHAYLFTKIFVA